MSQEQYEQCCRVLFGTPNCVLLRKREPVECILAVQEDLSAVACHSAQLAKGLLRASAIGCLFTEASRPVLRPFGADTVL